MATTPWWSSLDDECPITLEPLKELSYPPFSLHHHYFDGVALASYIVSRGVFLNPLTREPLTWGDARRLDDYIQLYHSTKSTSVSEAFGLHSNIQSKAVGDPRRAAYLRNEATAALCGLFVYRRNRAETSTKSTMTPQQKQTLPRSGFHLYDVDGKPKQSSATDSMEGFTLIDDDEQIIVNSENQDWNDLQKAFPPLSTAASTPVPTAADVALLQRIHQNSQALNLQEEQQNYFREQGKAMLKQAAQQRQDELRMQQQEAKSRYKETCIQQKQDQAVLALARKEIQAWRLQQWNELERIADEQLKTKRLSSEKVKFVGNEQEQKIGKNAPQPAIENNSVNQSVEKAAKLAAKRKRAKERKRAQKDEITKQVKEKLTLANLEAERKAASMQCASCHHGILDCGFDKGDHKFCSPKCARTGKVTLS